MSDCIPTLADVCCAIAEGKIPSSSDGSMYLVNARELRRYFNKSRPLPVVRQSSTPLTNASEWAAPTKTSLAIGR
jgi:hypothetical protein